MAFDLKASLAKITDADKKAKVEAALAEIDLSISALSETAEKIEQDRLDRENWEATKKTMEENYAQAEKDFYEMVADKSASQKEKDEALAKVKKLEAEKLEAQARVGELMKTPKEIDTSKFQTVEDAIKFEAGRTAYFAKVLKIQREHAKLFPDVELDPEKLVMDSLAAKKPIDEYYNETFKVGEKRAAIAKADKEKQDKDAEDRGYQRALAEMRNPALRTMDSSSDPFYAPKEAKQPWETEEELPEAQALVKELSKTVQ